VGNLYPIFWNSSKRWWYENCKERLDMRFNISPHEEQLLENVSQAKLTVFATGEEESTGKHQF